MSPELRSATAFGIAALVTFVATPLMIRVAVRTAFFDVPLGYKEHARPTPYLGGVAIMCGSADISHSAAISAALTESWPQPAHRVDIEPS